MSTMRDLCEQPVSDEDKGFFSRLVNILNQNYPHDWQSWEVENHSYSDLFGEQIKTETEKKLRFAIPTAELAHAYSPNNPTLSEKKYRLLKRKLLEWPLGRALIYAPHSVMKKIHPQSYEPFMCAVKILKPKLTSRKRNLSRQSSTSPSSKKPRQRSPPRPRRVLTLPSTSRSEYNAPSAVNSHHSSSATPRQGSLSNNALQMTFFEKMINILNVSTQTMSNIASQVADLSAKVNKDRPKSPFEADSEYGYEHSRFTKVNKNGPTMDPTKETYQSDDCDFSPSTTEAEPKLAKANPRLVEQGRKCQRLGDGNWKNVRYAEVQKHFHATPVFSALKVNSLLATNTPSWSSLNHLEKMDSTLGAITYGLLLQRAAFEEACKKLDKKSRKEVQSNFLEEGCEFKKISDNLLQYVCGRRAEIIQTRRETYKCPNKVLNDLLHDIPPSETHLFSEDKLSEVIKEHGGTHIFFPKKTLSINKPSKKSSAWEPSNKPSNAHTNKKFKKPTNWSFRSSWKHEKSASKTKPRD